MTPQEKFKYLFRQDHELKLNAHYACISAFFEGNSESYIRYYRDKIKKLESLGEPLWVDKKIKVYNNIIKFTLANIPPKIKWRVQ